MQSSTTRPDDTPQKITFRKQFRRVLLGQEYYRFDTCGKGANLFELLWSDMVDQADRVRIPGSIFKEGFDQDASLGNLGTHYIQDSVQLIFLLAGELLPAELVPCLVEELGGLCWNLCQRRFFESLQYRTCCWHRCGL